jgi:hypothetical protein
MLAAETAIMGRQPLRNGDAAASRKKGRRGFTMRSYTIVGRTEANIIAWRSMSLACP